MPKTLKAGSQMKSMRFMPKHGNPLLVLKSTATKDLYLRAIQEMYPGINTGRLSSNLTCYENWAQVRATAALKAFTTEKYDN